MFVLIFIHFIQGIKIKYGHEFGRKVLVFDSDKNDYIYV